FKRVMGVPGETIEVRESRVIVSGRAIPTRPLNRADFNWVPEVRSMGSSVEFEDGHYITYTPGKSGFRNQPAILLGPGEYFLLGDNRDDSWDSRAFGPVSENRILGKVM